MPVPTSGPRLDQRHGLAHHVRAHEGTVGVVVLQEGDHRGRDGHHLARGDVHVVDVVTGDVVDLAATTADQDAGSSKRMSSLERRVGLRDDEAVLFVGRQVVDLVGDDPSTTLRYGVSTKPNALTRP
jgi:hypothetical protein